MSYAVYKYVYNGEIIYVGKTNHSIKQRISDHANDKKFRKYINDCKIYCAECKNPAHTIIMETYLINKYKPILNVFMKYEDDLNLIIPDPKWIDYESFVKSIDNQNQGLINQQSKPMIIRNRSKRFHLNRYLQIDNIQNQIVGTLLVSQIITDHYQEIKENGYKYTIFIPNDKYAWNERYAMGLSNVRATYEPNKSWFGYRLIHSVLLDTVGYHAELFIHHELISRFSFHIKYKEKLHEEIQKLRLEQHQILQELIKINLLPITDLPQEYQWIYKWVLQEQSKP